MISMLLSILHSKRAIFCDFRPRSAEMWFSAHFCAPKRSFRPFSSKTLKTGMGQKCGSRQCFFRSLGGNFRKKAQNGVFLALWELFTTFGGQKLILRPKSEKTQKMAKDEKSWFSLRARNSENVRFWARFWSQKRLKSFFLLLGTLFRSGAFWAPKAPQKRKISSFSHFCFQKWKIRVFAILVEKRAQNVTFIKGFALLAKVSENHVFQFLIWFHVFMSRKE